MKNSVNIMSILLLSILLTVCKKENVSEKLEATQENAFDSTLAAELGADDYGMKSYITFV